MGPYLLWTTDTTIESDELEEVDRTISPTLAMIAMWVSREKESRDVKKVYRICFLGKADSFRQLSRPAGNAERAREGDINCRSSKRPQGVGEKEDTRSRRREGQESVAE